MQLLSVCSHFLYRFRRDVLEELHQGCPSDLLSRDLKYLSPETLNNNLYEILTLAQFERKNDKSWVSFLSVYVSNI